MKLGQTSAVYFLAQVGTSVVGFLATLYFTRTVDDAVLGRYFLFVAVLIYLTVLFGRTVQSAVVKRLSEGDDDGYVAAGLVVLAVAYAVIAGLLVAGRTVLTAYVGTDVLVPMLGLLGLSLAFAFVQGVLKGKHAVHVAGLLKPFERTVRSVVQVGLLAVGVGFAGLLLGYGVGVLAAAVVGAAYAAVRLQRPSLDHVRSLLSYVRYAWLGKASTRSFASMDTLVLGVFVAPNLIAYYEIAWNLASLLAIVGVAIAETTFPEFSRLAAGDRREQVADLLEDSLAFAGLFLVPGLVGSLLVGERVLRIYEPAYARAATVLVVLVTARVAYAYGSQLTTALNGLDRPDLAFRVNGVFLGANVVLNVVLVGLYGWTGAAVATAISAAASLVLAHRYLSGLLPLTVPWTELGRQAGAALAMGGVVVAAGSVLPTGIPATVLLVGIGGASYLAVLLVVSPRFRATVARNLPT